jgi:hypothetical protein
VFFLTGIILLWRLLHFTIFTFHSILTSISFFSVVSF